MKAILQHHQFAVRAGLLALACLALAPSVVGANVDGRVGNDGAIRHAGQAPAARAIARTTVTPRALLVAQSDAEQKMIDDCRKNFGTDCERKAKEAMMPPAERRQVMIERCRNNFGTDCEKSVDIELAAEQNQQRFIQPKPAQ